MGIPDYAILALVFCYNDESMEMNQQLFDEMREALLAISSNEHLNLGDLVYDVREREGEGWEGKWVTHWSDAVMKVNAVVEKIK